MLLLSSSRKVPLATVYNGFYLGLAIISSFILCFQLGSDKYLRGLDAYYYAVQADSWFSSGKLKIPDPWFLHYAIGALQYTGVTAETAIKLWTGISVFLFLAAILLFWRRHKPQPLYLFLFTWAMVSPSITFIAIEFPKTFSFMVVFTVVVASWSKINNSDGIEKYFLSAPSLSKRLLRWALLIGVCLLMLQLHKISLVYIAIFGLVFLGKAIGKYKNTLSSKTILSLFVFFIIITLGCFWVAKPVVFSILQRLEGSNLTPSLIALFLHPTLPLAIKIEFGFAALIILVSLLTTKKKGIDLVLVMLLIASTFMPCLSDESFSVGERFAILFPYLCILSTAILKPDFSQILGWRAAFTFLALGLGLLGWRLSYSFPDDLSPPYAKYDHLVSELSYEKIPMLILHRGIHFYYKYKTKQEAFSYEPEAHWNKQRIWRLVYGMTSEEIYAYLPENCSWGKPHVSRLSEKEYTLMREDCYYGLRQKVSIDSNPELYNLLWIKDINPNKKRPLFLYRKHVNDDLDEFPAIAPN